AGLPEATRASDVPDLGGEDEVPFDFLVEEMPYVGSANEPGASRAESPARVAGVFPARTSRKERGAEVSGCPGGVDAARARHGHAGRRHGALARGIGHRQLDQVDAGSILMVDGSVRGRG